MLSGNRSSRKDTETCIELNPIAWDPAYLTDSTLKCLVSLIGLLCVTSVLTVALNSLVIHAVRTRSRLRSNANVLLACLAVTDLMVGILIQPLLIAKDLTHIFGLEPSCIFHLVCYQVLFFSSMLSFSHLLLVSLERYIGIKYQLRYHEIVTKWRLKAAVVMAWLFTVVFTMIKLISRMNSRQYLYNWSDYFDMIIILKILVCIVSTIYINRVTLLEVRRLETRLQTELVPQEQKMNLKKSKKGAITVSIILSALLLSYLPFLVLRGLTIIFPDFRKKQICYLLSSWFLAFVSLSSLLNPLVYSWRRRSFRQTFLEMLNLRNTANDPVREEIGMHRRHTGLQEPTIHTLVLAMTLRERWPVAACKSAMYTARLSPVQEIDENLEHEERHASQDTELN